MLSNFFFDKVYRDDDYLFHSTKLLIKVKRLFKNCTHLKEFPFIEITRYRRRRKGLLKYK